MNRHEHRRAARGKAKPFDRAALIASTVDILARTTDETVTGATLMLPSGEMIYLPAAPLQSDGSVQ